VKPSSRLKPDDFYYWLLDRWIVTSGEFGGQRYRFLPNYPFMEAYAKDLSPFIVVMKSAQVGVTEINVARLYFYADKLRGNLMYVLPTDDLAKTLSRGRIKEAHRKNSYLEDKLTGFDSIHQYRFKENFIYIRGSQTQIKDGRMYQRQLISIDASRLFGDEVDEWNAGVFPKLQSRIGASLDPIQIYFSTPRLVDGGISKLYALSDMKKWAIKCRRCNEWNIGLTLQDNVTNWEYPWLEHEVICKHCHRPLDRLEDDPHYAQWVATNPDTGKWSGYHFNKLFFRAANLDLIVDRFNDPETQQECYNDDLGLPYEPKAYNIDVGDIRRCACPLKKDWDEIIQEKPARWIGVDIGKKIHYNIRGQLRDSDKHVIVDVGTVFTFEELANVVKESGVRVGIIDAQPDFRASLEFCMKMEEIGTFKVAYFDTSRGVKKERYLVKVDNQNPYVCVISRNFAMSEVMHEIISGNVILPWEAEFIDGGDYLAHMRVPVRTYREDPSTNQLIMHFPPSRRPDHHYLAQVYSRCAAELVEEEMHFGKRWG